MAALPRPMAIRCPCSSCRRVIPVASPTSRSTSTPRCRWRGSPSTPSRSPLEQRFPTSSGARSRSCAMAAHSRWSSRSPTTHSRTRFPSRSSTHPRCARVRDRIRRPSPGPPTCSCVPSDPSSIQARGFTTRKPTRSCASSRSCSPFLCAPACRARARSMRLIGLRWARAAMPTPGRCRISSAMRT